MLFLSPHPAYMICGLTPTKDLYHPATGTFMGVESGIDAVFTHGGVPSWALEQALANPRFQQAWGGLPDDADRRAYVASFDTDIRASEDGWSDEIKDFVEEYLLGFPDYGTRYVVAVEDRVEAPWANYDETHHAQIVQTGKQIGVSPAQVLAYERQQRKRPFVIEKVEEWAAEANAEPARELLVTA